MPLNQNQSILEFLGHAGTGVLRMLPPETAHRIGVALLAHGLLGVLSRWVRIPNLPQFETTVPGLGALPHPIGLAAGFDKNAEAIHGLASLGFSQIEIGAVTPRAQPGNPAPRLFRYPAEQALINRMGFNNDGMDAIRDRLTAALRDRNDFDRCVLGVNLGKNKDTPAEGALDDFLKVHDSLKDVARFFVMNLSSPNTPGLRDLARPDFLRQAAVGYGPDIKRVWIKFDPDMEKARFQELINEVGRSGFAGVVLTNTHRVEKPEAGGLSGRPVARLSNRMLEWAWEVHRGALPMIGVGGIMTGRDVLDKIMRGAFAVQIYTAFIYRGPLVVTQLLREFEMEMRQHGFDTVAGAIGTYYNPITRGSNTHPSPGSNLPGTSK